MEFSRSLAVLGWLGMCGIMASAGGCATKKVMPVYTDPQQIIMVSPGQKFQIRLPSDRAGGLEWQMPYANDGGYLKLIGTHYPIGVGEQTWTFRAVVPGDAFIPLEYVQAFEYNLPTVKSATFKVSIH